VESDRVDLDELGDLGRGRDGVRAVDSDVTDREAVRRTHVEEVDPEAVDCDPVLGERVEACFERRNVVLVRPRGARLLRVLERDPVGPVVDRLSLGLACARAARAVLHLAVRHLHRKRCDLPYVHCSVRFRTCLTPGVTSSCS
jgi:hypothetical protein